MSNISKMFVMSSVVFLLIGMVWGIQMSATQDHSLAPAHGHLNLIGFVMMMMTGIYYAVTPAAAQSSLAKIHFGGMILTIVIMAPGIAMAINGDGDTLAKLGSILGVVVVLLFGWIVVKFGVGSDG